MVCALSPGELSPAELPSATKEELPSATEFLSAQALMLAAALTREFELGFWIYST